MGCGQSAMEQQDPEAYRQHNEIEKALQQEAKIRASTTSIFLCGTGESGKSTVLKQMRLVYADPYSLDERLEYKSVILSNLSQSMLVILEAMSEFGIEMTYPEAEKWSSIVMDLPPIIDDDGLSHEAIDAIGHLWNTSQVRDVVSKAAQFQLNDSAPYYFENLDRITSRKYVPTDDDILRARVRTTGIIESKFKVKDRIYRVLDVGGQRSERRKWIACFENVDVLLFLFAISEYDQNLFEDETTNRFIEAEQLFSSIANSMWFKKSTLIVFLNKIDLFAAKIQSAPLQNYLLEYNGPNTYESCISYVKERVLSHYKGVKVPYCHETCATDTKSFAFIITAIHDEIVSSLLKDTFLV